MENEPTDTAAGEYCPSCGEEVAEGSGFCRHCGEPLTDNVEAAPATDSVEESQEDPTNDSRSGLQQLGHWGGRVVQLVLVAVAVILLIGGLEMNMIAFAAIGIFALVLLAGVGIIELLIIRPLS